VGAWEQAGTGVGRLRDWARKGGLGPLPKEIDFLFPFFFAKNSA
jgi:hypothetical protein